MTQVINNIPNSTADWDLAPFSSRDCHVTTDDGYIFKGVPTLTSTRKGKVIYEDVELTVSKENTYANVRLQNVSSDDIYTFKGETVKKGSEPTEPTIANNVSNSDVNCKVDGSKCNFTITSNVDTEALRNITVTYTKQNGTETTVNVPVNYTVSDVKVASTGSVSLSDIDYSKTVTFNGDNTQYRMITYDITNSVSSYTDKFAFVGDSIKFKITANDGFGFTDKEQIYLLVNGAKSYFEIVGKKNCYLTYTVAEYNLTIYAKPVNIPTITNNVNHSHVKYTVDGSKCDFTITSNVDTEALRNITVTYTKQNGTETTVNVTVNYTVSDDKVASTGSVSLSDIDYSKTVTFNGDNTKYHIIVYSLSGCKSNIDTKFLFDGDIVTVTLTADDGNEFGDGSQVYIDPQGSFSGSKVNLTISSDKKTANGSYKITFNDDEILIFGDTTQIKPTPIKKYGSINAYVVNEDNLETFAENRFVYSGSSSEEIESYDLGNYVNKVKRFFFDVEKGTTSKLKCGNFVVDTDVYNLANDTKEVDFGTVDVPNLTGSTADYEADLLMFVPFIGVVSLDSDMIGKTVSLSLKVNLLSGDGVYILMCDGVIRWNQTVNPTTDVIYRTSTQDASTIGDINYSSTYLMGLQPYVIVEKRTIVNTDCETSAERFTKVSDVTGFAKMANVHFEDTANMMSDDIKEIESLLRNGFHV